MAKTFVTGGSGLLGRALIQRLVAGGQEVVALARSDSASLLLEGLGARVERGDVLDPPAVEAATRGSALVYNLAGVNEFCSPDTETMRAVNIEGAGNVVRAAARAGVGRVVHTSSAATIGEAKGTRGNEQTSHRGWFLSAYERSKYEGERLVLTEAATLGVDVVCVNPSSVQGPGRSGGTARLLLAAARGRLPVVVDTRFSLVDLADCVEGHLLAARHGAVGQRYVLSGATLGIGEALDLLARLTGRQPRPVKLPVPVVFALAGVVQQVSRLRGVHASLCPELVRTLAHGHAYDGSRAMRELGLRYTPVEDTIRRTVAWFRQQGLLGG